MKRIKKIVCLLICIVLISSILAISGIQNASAVNYKSFSLNNNWYSGSITSTNTEQFYKFSLTSDGEITIKLMHYMDCYFYIYNEDFSNTICYKGIYGGSSTSPETETYTYNLSKGDYYIKVSAYKTGNYKLCGNFISFDCNEIEPNNFDNAVSLAESFILKGCFTSTDTSDDWYKIYVPTTCSVDFKLKHYMECYFSIFNDDLSVTIHNKSIYGGSSTSPETETYTYNLSKGDYYIKVSAYKTGKYELNWKMNFSPEIPENLIITNNKAKQISMNWEEVDDCDGYQIQKKEGRKWSTIGTTNQSYFTAKKLNPSKKYSFRIRSYTTYKGKNYYSNWSEIKTTVTTPIKVKLISVKRNSFRGINIKWKKLQGVSGYQIQYSQNKNFSSYNTYTVNNKSKSASINYLYSYRNYFVRVVAYKTYDGDRYFGPRSKMKSVYIK